MRGGIYFRFDVPAAPKPVYTPAEQAAIDAREAKEISLFQLVAEAPDVKTAGRILDLWVSGDEQQAREVARGGCACTTAEAAGHGTAQPCAVCMTEASDEIPF